MALKRNAPAPAAASEPGQAIDDLKTNNNSTGASNINIQPAVLSAITSEKPKILSKRLFLDSQGQLKKIAAAEMTEGTADRISVSSLKDLAEILTHLEKNQAL